MGTVTAFFDKSERDELAQILGLRSDSVIIKKLAAWAGSNRTSISLGPTKKIKRGPGRPPTNARSALAARVLLLAKVYKFYTGKDIKNSGPRNPFICLATICLRRSDFSSVIAELRRPPTWEKVDGKWRPRESPEERGARSIEELWDLDCGIWGDYMLPVRLPIRDI